MPRFSDAPPTLTDLVKSINLHIAGAAAWDKFKRMYANDREAFAYDLFPDLKTSLAPYQAEILGMFDSGATRVAVRSPHGAGKTLLASILVHHAVLTATSDCKVPTTARAWRKLEK